MHPLIQAVCDGIREELFGIPAGLRRSVNNSPAAWRTSLRAQRSIDVNSVPQWHEWGLARSPYDEVRGDGGLLGWRFRAGQYESFEHHLPALEAFGKVKEYPQWSCEIQDVLGLARADATLADYADMDELVEENAPELIASISAEKLDQNLARSIVSTDATGDEACFVRYLWDYSVFLMNDKEAYHFAAARYIAARIRHRIVVHGKLQTRGINEAAVEELCERFDMFAIPDTPDIDHAFHESMRTFCATYLWVPMPQAFPNTRAILLPKSERRSRRAAAELRRVGAFDLGEYFSRLCARQYSPAHANDPLREEIQLCPATP
jgi:hypothetical protein